MNIKKFLKNPNRIFYSLGINGYIPFFSDETYLKLMYRCVFEKKLNLENPKTFNEKLQWLKLHNRRPEYTQWVDKYEVKKYISKVLGDEYVIPTLGVWNSFDDIDFSKLPNQFVLKCTHDSGGLVICKDKSKLNIKEARKKINRCLKKSYYKAGREWPYKNVKPRIIAEKYMEDTTIQELRDYKFFCFDGKAKIFKIDFDRFKNHKANYYDINGSILSLGEEICPPDYEKKINIPPTIDRMVELCSRLAMSQQFLRVDFYDVNGKIYFGELTLYPSSGFGKFIDESWDYKLGEWLVLD